MSGGGVTGDLSTTDTLASQVRSFIYGQWGHAGDERVRPALDALDALVGEVAAAHQGRDLARRECDEVYAVNAAAANDRARVAEAALARLRQDSSAGGEEAGSSAAGEDGDAHSRVHHEPVGERQGRQPASSSTYVDPHEQHLDRIGRELGTPQPRFPDDYRAAGTELRDALRDEIAMEDQARGWVEQAVTLIRAGFDTEVSEGLALLDNALQDLRVDDRSRALAADADTPKAGQSDA